MPRIKQPPTLSKTSLSDLSIAFTETKHGNIPLHHPDLANKSFVELTTFIEECGGEVVTKIAEATHLVATPEQYQKKGARVKDAIKSDVIIVSYDWLAVSLDSQDAINDGSLVHHDPQLSTPTAQTNGAMPQLLTSATATSKAHQTNGKSSKHTRDEEEDEKANVKKPKLPSSVAPTVQVPVDKHYGEKRCQVYQDDQGVFFDATLNQTQSGKNANKFYRLQLLQHHDRQYYTWTRWGRVGDAKGQCKVLGTGDLEIALVEFQKKFKDKTGLAWADRDAAPKPKKYAMLEINYEESDDVDDLPGAGPRRGSKESHISSQSSESVESKLPEPVARLMSLIFNNEYFNNTLADLDYDADKMPLGKLSKKTLLKGYEVLKDLAGIVGSPGPGDHQRISDLSDQYFSLIPHAFGRSRPPVLAKIDMIKKEVTLLENLTDMQLTNEIMKKAKSDKVKQEEKVALVDRQYQGLGMREMTALDHKSTEYKELVDYLVKSAGKTHGVRYLVQDVFRIERQGEHDRFKRSQFGKLDEGKSDRRLLWHGSRTTNFGGILSQGLRIAPIEAPVSGFMFGRGIYLADISTKSANYCSHMTSGNTGLLLLAEAELGMPSLKLTDAAYDAGEQAREQGCISTWGVGMTAPRGWKDAKVVHPDLEGVIMPDVSMEPGPSNEPNAYLLYNEFICYAVEQVRLRYLFRVQM